LETVAMALELVLASKRLLGSDIPQGNTKLPCPWWVQPQINLYMIGMNMSNLQSVEWVCYWAWAWA